ncbi:MAG: Rab family GTPase [Candidatus Hermodarchaeota archaeon]
MIVSEINIKLTIFGYWGVGKTSMTNAFMDKEIPSMYIPTIGSNIVRKEYKLKDEYIRVNIWDIGGQRSFNPLNPVFFSNIDAAFLVFDLTNPKETLLELKRTYLENLRNKSPECIVFLIGNKSDLIKPEDSDVLLNNVRQSVIKELPLVFISAKTKANLSEAFELIIFRYLMKLEKESNTEQFKGIANEFIGLINKNTNDLINLIVNLEDVDSTILEKKITPRIVKKIVTPDYEQLEIKTNKIDYSDFQANLVEFDLIKNSIIETFKNNLNIVQDLILSLKATPIDSLMEKIEKISEELNQLREDFELKLDNILNLNSNK